MNKSVNVNLYLKSLLLVLEITEGVQYVINTRRDETHPPT